MAKKRNKKNTQINSPPQTKNLVLPLWTILLILFAFIFGIIFLYLQFRPTEETRHSEVKRLPPEIKQRIAQQPKPPKEVRVPILLYHYVEFVQDKGDTIRQSLDIIPPVFDAQVKTLKDAGYTFLTARDLAEIIDGKKPLPDKPILLTFDDGHRDFATDAMPILEKYHVKATQYVITGLLGGSDFMTVDQLRDVVNSGLVEIGAHTVHHISLAGKLAPVVDYEVSQSKSFLELTYHIKVVSFAYPNGSFDNQAADIVKNDGFKTAVSTIPGVMQSEQNRYFLYRLRPGYLTGPALISFLEKNNYQNGKYHQFGQIQRP